MNARWTVALGLLAAGTVVIAALPEDATPVTYPGRASSAPPSTGGLRALLSGLPSMRVTGAVGAHDMISEYLGPQTCVACHRDQAEQMHGSVHYQQTGPTPNVPNIPGYAGERGFGDIGFNTYCGTHVTSSRATCGGCHVGNGQFPSPEISDEQLNNIDCLMCHQDQYKRIAAGPYETIPVTGSDGIPGSATIRVPVEDASGFHYMPDEDAMDISILEAARTVHLPTRASCLRCHAGAGGGDGTKRGDLSSGFANPTPDLDIHMGGGSALVCADCHSAGNHRVRGRGLDLRPNDTPERFTCESCHGDRPHGDYSGFEGSRRDTHAGRVACQSCHIPTYAKDVSTEVARDWTNRYYSPQACSGQGGWKPEEIHDSNLVPTYAWFDGTSYVYVLGQLPPQRSDGAYGLGAPMGSVAADSNAKLYPMKEHRSNAARLVSIAGDLNGDGRVDRDDLVAFVPCLEDPTACDTADINGDGHIDLGDYAELQLCAGGTCGTPGEMIPHSTFTFFTTGEFEPAVEAGMAAAGLRGQWELVDLHTYQTLNHGVEDHDYALQCGACHESLEGGPVRMDLAGDLGYELKASSSVVCQQCHGPEGPLPFRSVHDKHVKNRHYDCSWCHTFARPSRGLTMPPGTD